MTTVTAHPKSLFVPAPISDEYTCPGCFHDLVADVCPSCNTPSSPASIAAAGGNAAFIQEMTAQQRRDAGYLCKRCNGAVSFDAAHNNLHVCPADLVDVVVESCWKQARDAGVNSDALRIIASSVVRAQKQQQKEQDGSDGGTHHSAPLTADMIAAVVNQRLAAEGDRLAHLKQSAASVGKQLREFMVQSADEICAPTQQQQSNNGAAAATIFVDCDECVAGALPNQAAQVLLGTVVQKMMVEGKNNNNNNNGSSSNVFQAVRGPSDVRVIAFGNGYCFGDNDKFAVLKRLGVRAQVVIADSADEKIAAFQKQMAESNAGPTIVVSTDAQLTSFVAAKIAAENKKKKSSSSGDNKNNNKQQQQQQHLFLVQPAAQLCRNVAVAKSPEARFAASVSTDTWWFEELVPSLFAPKKQRHQEQSSKFMAEHRQLRSHAKKAAATPGDEATEQQQQQQPVVSVQTINVEGMQIPITELDDNRVISFLASNPTRTARVCTHYPNCEVAAACQFVHLRRLSSLLANRPVNLEGADAGTSIFVERVLQRRAQLGLDASLNGGGDNNSSSSGKAAAETMSAASASSDAASLVRVPPNVNVEGVMIPTSELQITAVFNYVREHPTATVKWCVHHPQCSHGARCGFAHRKDTAAADPVSATKLPGSSFPMNRPPQQQQSSSGSSSRRPSTMPQQQQQQYQQPGTPFVPSPPPQHQHQHQHQQQVVYAPAPSATSPPVVQYLPPPQHQHHQHHQTYVVDAQGRLVQQQQQQQQQPPMMALQPVNVNGQTMWVVHPQQQQHHHQMLQFAPPSAAPMQMAPPPPPFHQQPQQQQQQQQPPASTSSLGAVAGAQGIVPSTINIEGEQVSIEDLEPNDVLVFVRLHPLSPARWCAHYPHCKVGAQCRYAHKRGPHADGSSSLADVVRSNGGVISVAQPVAMNHAALTTNGANKM